MAIIIPVVVVIKRKQAYKENTKETNETCYVQANNAPKVEIYLNAGQNASINEKQSNYENFDSSKEYLEIAFSTNPQQNYENSDPANEYLNIDSTPKNSKPTYESFKTPNEFRN